MNVFAMLFVAVLGMDCLLGGWLFALLAGKEPLMREFFSAQGSWWLWRSHALWQARPFLAGAAVVLAGSAWILGWRSQRRSSARWVKGLLPLALAPLLVAVLLYRDCLPRAWVANLIFYFPLFLLSLSLAAWLSGLRGYAWPARLRLNAGWTIGIVASICFFLTGVYYTHSCGAHSGDEGHYLILATSLFEDHDLDIKNNLINEIGSENVERLGHHYLHVSSLSRPPGWYSYHAPGLAFPLAPVVPCGAAARHGVLGIMAGLACVAMWLLCRRAGASLTACGVVLAAFWCSIYWTVYSSRALPEVLGAGLTAWLCWCALAQKEYPWRTALLAGFCCAYLPWANIRFYPLALAGLALYCASSLRIYEPLARRCLRLGVFLLIGLGGIAVYRHIQNAMFVGGFSHEVGKILLLHPPGLWRVLTNPVGLLNILPMALWMMAAGLVWIGVARPQRWMAVCLCGMAVFSWLCTCAVPNYGGGASLGGRFLLVVMPLLLPASAALWDRATPAARWWLIFLAAVSIGLCGLELLYLPELGKSFAFPFCELPVVVPILEGVHYPFCGPEYVVVFFVLTMILVGMRSARLAMGLTVAMVIASVIWHGVSSPRARTIELPHDQTDPVDVASYLAELNPDRICVTPRRLLQGRPLFEVSDYLRLAGQSNAAPSLTTRDLGVRMRGRLVSQPRLEINDWQGRPYRWTTLAEPFAPGRGQRAFSLEGHIEGSVTPIFAVREGTNTIMEQPLPVDAQGLVRLKIAVYTEGRCGNLYLLLRLEGVGVFHPHRMHWSPISLRLLDQAGLVWSGNGANRQKSKVP